MGVVNELLYIAESILLDGTGGRRVSTLRMDGIFFPFGGLDVSR